ncbi:MAG: ATP-dependent DNA helicase [Methanocellales archaeon]
MKISELNGYLPSEVLKFYEAQGINELYPPQAEAVKLGIFEGKNILAAIPTASGKTLIAEFAMLNSILNKGGKALYIVPLRALASEKYEYFSKFDRFNIKVGISTGDFDRRDEWLGRNDIIIATSEKADSLLRNQSPWMNEITVIVIDEIHLIDQGDRGPTLEVTIAKLKKLNPNAQIIALSATIGNPEELANWLQAELLVSDYRPVKLKEGVFFGRVIFFKEEKREIELEEKEETISLALDTVKEGGQCLIFTSSRRNAESIALRISRILKSKKISALDLASAVEATAETEICRKLAACLEGGAAFHHAGLRAEHRKIVEDGFRGGKIKIIACTPTLAAGLNLPARRVIIKEYKRYDPNFGSQALPVLEVKQMGGRAGRPGLDPYGEAVLLAKSHRELLKLMAEYINAKPERIYSKLGTEPALRTHVLSLIATGFANTRSELQEFIMTTFFGYQRLDIGMKIEPLLSKLIAFFESEKMISIQGEFLSPTSIGSLISRLYIDPLSASIMIKALGKSNQPSTFALLHVICSTPDMRRLYLRSRDYDWILKVLIEREHELLEHKNAFNGEEYEWYLSEVKTALMLESWISEEKEELITKRFNIGPGDIRALAETAEWLAHAFAELAKHLKHPASKLARELEQRLRYGAATELLPLIQLRDVGRVRARMLYNSGYRNLEALRNASVEELAKVPAIGEKIARKILQQVWGGIGINEEERIIYKQSKLFE